MSIQQKRRNSKTEMSRLKKIWRDTLSEDQRDYWREQFESDRSKSDLQNELKSALTIELKHNSQFTRFRSWAEDFAALEEEKQNVAADIAELEALGLSGQELNDELLRRLKARALHRGDYELGLKAILADVRIETLQLSREKFKESLKTKIRSGLDAILAEARGNAAIAAAVKQIQEATI